MQTAATLRRVAAVRSHDVLHHSSGGHAVPYAALYALRYYEDQGLLTNVEHTETGQRIYEDCHIDSLARFVLKNAGMTIDDLKKFFVYESNEPRAYG